MYLDGKWRGVINYGKERNIRGKTLSFEMIIKQEDNNFQGTAQDIDGLGAHPEPASIKGEKRGNQIFFIKQYPSFHYMGKRGEVKIHKSLTGPEITYSGVVDNEEQSIHGEWEMKVTWYLFGLIPWKHTQRGTWEMNRLSASAS